MKFNTIIPSAAIILSLCTASIAADIKIGDLSIEAPAIRATVPNAKVAGGFMIIKNTGKQADRLIGGSASFAGKVEIHKMAVTDGIMRMRKLSDGLEIPAGGSVHLKPGGFHVMFMKLGEQMKEGETRKAIVKFKNAGKVEVEFAVKSIAATMKHGKMDHSKMSKDGMNHKKMKHSEMDKSKMKKESN